MEPRRHRIESAGLGLNVLEWPAADGAATVLLHHGFLDCAAAWRPVAESLAGRYRVLATDARGHGDSDWVGAGGYYHFQDYTFDLHAVCEALAPERLVLVGHSMGGMACGYFAGAFPERTLAYVSIEGLGPPDNDFSTAPDRMRLWIESVARMRARPERVFADVEAAAARLRETNPRLTTERARTLASDNTRATDGGFRWKFDPLHQSRSPQPFYLAQARAFWRRIVCPTLYVDGGASGFAGAYAQRLQDFADVRHATIPDAGHMIHHEQPEELAQALGSFLREVIG